MAGNRPSPTRRVFLRSAAAFAGAATLIPSALAQTTPPPYPDPNELCVPPTYNNPAVNNQPMPDPVPFKSVSRPIVQRKSIWDLSSSEVTRLNAAYAALRALPASDPRGWLPTAHVHCFYCSGSSGNPSQIEIHGGWYFMPWHRAYLYFHERILASLVGDDTFYLPYWDWDNPAHSVFPPTYMAAGSSLVDTFRFSTSPLASPLDGAFQTYQIDIPALLADSDYELFMGTAPDNFNNYGGNVENGPHGLVHVWVGNPEIDFNDPLPDMGILQTAARDPIFFAHHTNIDKLWATWNANGPDHLNPTDCRWSGQRWNFYDENKQWTSIAVSDVLDTEGSLYYNYYGLSSPVAKSMAVGGKVFESVKAPTHQTPEPTTSEVPLPAKAPEAFAATARKTKYVLHIDGIQLPPDLGAAIRVFVNLPTATADTPSTSPNYVGYFIIVPKVASGGLHSHRATNIALDVTKKLPAILGTSNKLTVTLVPSTAKRQKPKQLDLTYDKVWIETK